MPSFAERVSGVLDAAAALYIPPILRVHEHVYGSLNVILKRQLDVLGDKQRVPAWFTADFITWGRTMLLLPTLALLGSGYEVWPALLVLLVDFGDFLDGVVARWWISRRAGAGAPAPVGSVERLTLVQRRETVPSAKTMRLTSQWGQWFDAEMDKAFLLPVWLVLLVLAGAKSFVSFFVLWGLILIEGYSGVVRAQRYYGDSPHAAPPGVSFGAARNDSGVKSDEVGKAKQTLQMVGTALFILHFGHYAGLVLLLAAIPLAWESLRRKIQHRVVFAVLPASEALDYSTLVYLDQARALGSHLIVGLLPVAPGSAVSARQLELAAAVPSVDRLVALVWDTPVDRALLQLYGAHVVVRRVDQARGSIDPVLEESEFAAVLQRTEL